MGIKPRIKAIVVRALNNRVSATSRTIDTLKKDIDNDIILYRFFLDGQEVKAWTDSNIWNWNTSETTPKLP